MKPKKANVTLLFVFVMIAGVIILLTAVFAPMGALFSTNLYAAGEDILMATNDSIANINDAEVKTAIYSVVDEAFAAQENNVNVSVSLYTYSWIFVIVISSIVIFLLARRNVELGTGGFI